jgi:hypothetical protein
MHAAVQVEDGVGGCGSTLRLVWVAVVRLEKPRELTRDQISHLMRDVIRGVIRGVIRSREIRSRT